MISKSQKLLKAFQTGQEMTSKQIESRFGLTSARGAVFQLRQQGYPIYLNERTNSKGKVTNKYRLGTPTRSVIAAGMKAVNFGKTA